MYYLLILAIVVWYAFEHTPIGRYMFATGGNPDAARLAGVRTDRLVWASLVASTVIAGFAGLIYSWKVGTYNESIGPGYLFPAIAAVFFGASQLPGPLAPGCRVARQPSPRHEGSQAPPGTAATGARGRSFRTVTIFGTRVPRVEDRALLTAGGSYIDDHAFDGAAFGTFVRSTEAHARIAEIDVTEALRAPGVVADHSHLARTSPWSTSTWRPER